MPTTSSSFAHSAAGLSAGSLSTFLLYPVDLVKIRLQVNESSTRAAAFRGTQALAEVKTLLRAERAALKRSPPGPGRPLKLVPPFLLKYRALYSGLTPSLAGNGLSWGGYFLVYNQAKTLLLSGKEAHSNADYLLASALSGTCMVCLTNPIWLVKTRMQLQVKAAAARPYRNVPDAFRTIVREEGVGALYKGVGPAMMLVSHGMVQFAIYENLKLLFPANARKPVFKSGPGSAPLTPWHKMKDSMGYLCMGAVSKVVASTVTYPIQVIKSRMQQRSTGWEVVKGSAATAEEGTLKEFTGRSYPTFLSAVRRVHGGEGLMGFWKGAGTNAFRVAPNAAITFLTYETVVDALS
ncbi:hypothetical protein TeGR_g13757 [Tetraparma gracilis]|uniref:Mitochondrial carrier n=1 Tax=Tetraparma gracilis TaxID=2962635 RepID=A0ABQ6MIN1_9STRA|nr:hypothetical protein TeGR_g13757 [Tetraparma gracilis]